MKDQCSHCGGFITKTFASFRNFSYCPHCEPHVKQEIKDYLKTVPIVGFSGGSGKRRFMTEWIKCTDRVPQLYEVVWIYWRNREVLLGCKMNADGNEPHENWYSFKDEKCRWAHWWIPVNEYTWDKPKPPEDL